ncbi:hypothetical protein N781_04865, partial [Pontibacillus halophilus JSM 076056 = DSM 19796]
LASQILNEQSLLTNEEELNRFIQEASSSLAQKGFWAIDDDGEVREDVKALVQDLVQAERKARAVRMRDRSVLLLHYTSHEQVLIQRVEGKLHKFRYTTITHPFGELVKDFFSTGSGNELEQEGIEVNPLQLSSSDFDDIHTTDPSVLEALVKDDAADLTMRAFAKAFLQNSQELDNLSFMHSNYVEDQSVMEQVIFLLPTPDFVWHIDYDQVNEDVIYAQPVSYSRYIDELERGIVQFFYHSYAR